MASIPKSQANTDSTTAQTAIMAAEDQNFIDSVDASILEATALGKFQVSATTWENVDVPTVYNYYVNLGYKVSFPDIFNMQQPQPAELFGEPWIDFWGNGIWTKLPEGPARLLISWS